MSEKLSLSASERIAALLDDSSFVEIGSGVTARSTDFNETKDNTPRDGVITGYGVIDGKLVYVYSQDATVLGGSVGEMHAKKISNLYNLALKVGAPVVGLIDCAGLRLQEATDSLHAFGALMRKSTLASGVIPQITVVFGNCGGGAGILSSLSDFTFMTKSSKLFVNSPNTLDGNYEGKLDTAAADYVAENTGLADNVFASDVEALTSVRNLVTLLPSNNEDEAFVECSDDLNRTAPGIENAKDDSRVVIANVADDGIYVEVKKTYGTDVTTGFIRLNGATVGVVANQVADGSDRLSTQGAEKAAEFVNFCDAFSIPVLTLTNVAGFAATVEEEKTVGKAAARLAAAFVDATVPKVNVVTGVAYGSAYSVMNSKAVGADIVYAWPGAKIGAMDSENAAKIIYSDDISNAADAAAAIVSAKAKIEEDTQNAAAVARRGYVDDVIEADATRKRVIAAFEMLASKREDRPAKKHLAF